MARYTGPSTKIARKFGEPIFGSDKYFEKRNFPPGQHGLAAKRKKSKEYATQLKEKQKVKYMYGVLERQFHNTYDKASRMAGQKGENLVLLLESRLDNIVYRLGIAPTRAAARQLVSHHHITLNGNVCSIPSTQVKAGDTVAVRERSKSRRFRDQVCVAGLRPQDPQRQVSQRSDPCGNPREHQRAAHRRPLFQVIFNTTAIWQS